MKIVVFDRIGSFSPIFVNHWRKKHDVSIVSDPGWDLREYDVLYFDWADNLTAEALRIGIVDNQRVIVHPRRYELFSMGMIKSINWDLVDEVIFNTKFLKQMAYSFYGIEKFQQGHIIPNGVDLSDWTFKEREHGNKFAMVGLFDMRKNLPMALQILAIHQIAAEGEFELHLGGIFKDMALRLYVEQYIQNAGLKDRVFFSEKMVDTDEFLEDKDYLLQTSISEGVSNVVIEAMAKGIKPIIHRGLGQKFLYPEESMFSNVSEVLAHTCGKYKSQVYRDFVKDNYDRQTTLDAMDALLPVEEEVAA